MKPRYFILCIQLVLISATSVIGQKSEYKQLADSLYSVWQKDKRIAKFDSITDFYAQVYGEEEAAIFSHEISIRYYKSRNYQAALRFGQKEADIYEKINLLNKTYAQALYQNGFLLEKLQNFDSATVYYQRVIKDNIDPSRTARAYCKMGYYYFGMGDFYKALAYYEKGINQLEALEEYKYMINPCIYLSYVYQRIPDESYRKDRLTLISKLNMLREKHKFSNSRLSVFHNIIASYYNSDKNSSGEYDFQKAKYHYQQAINYSQSNNVTSILSTIYSNIGNLYQKERKDSATYFFRKSLAYGPNRNDEILIHRNLYDYYYHRNQLQNALTSINKSLAVNLSVSEDSVDQASYDRYYNSMNQDEALSAIINKVHVLIKLNEENDTKDHLVRLAIKLIDIADRLITSVQNESSTKDSKLYWRERATDVYSKGILLASKTSNFDKAFYYSEKIKSLLLIQNILAESIKESLPGEIKSKELVLKSRVLEKEKQLKSTADERQQTKLREIIVNDKIAYQTFLDSLQHIYPEFYANKNNVEIADLKLLQSQMTDSSAI
ncbi:MAG: tetratricopeptide repeat protein, partial [Cyclobacteriaceae bacterium]